MTIKIKTSAEIEQIGKLRVARFTYKAIAERFGVGISTIRDVCKKHGYEPQSIAGYSLQDGQEQS